MTLLPLVPFQGDPLQGHTAVTTIGEFFAAGGELMWPILGCSVVVLGLSIERYYTLRRSNLLPPAVQGAIEQVLAGGEPDPAGLDRSAAGRALAAGLRRRGLPLPDVERAMADQLHKESARLRGNVRGISLMAAVAPLLGLLGTVLGIAEAFATVEQTGMGKPEFLAAGIKVALYTTIFGLGVAIPATLLAEHLGGRVRSRLLMVAEALDPAIERLAAAQEGRTHAA